jgi:hypothetical protein
MWVNPMRERERERERETERERERLLFIFRKVQYNKKIKFPSKRNTSQHQTVSHNFLPWKMCPSPYSCTTFAKYVSRKPCPVECCTNCKVRPNNNKKTPTVHLDFHAKGLLENRYYLPVVQTVRIFTIQPNTKQLEQHYTHKITLGLVPSFSWEICPPIFSLSSLNLTHKISLNHLLLSSRCVFHTTQCIIL